MQEAVGVAKLMLLVQVLLMCQLSSTATGRNEKVCALEVCSVTDAVEKVNGTTVM